MEGYENHDLPPRFQGIQILLTSLVQNDDAYVRGERTRQEWTEQAQDIDAKLTVIGLRLAGRPWRDVPPGR
jgi:hypothetical protein